MASPGGEGIKPPLEGEAFGSRIRLAMLGTFPQGKACGFAAEGRRLLRIYAFLHKTAGGIPGIFGSEYE